LVRHAMSAGARFVGSSLYVVLQKPLDPLGHKAPADSDRRGNSSDRDSVGEEEEHPAAAGTPRRDGRGPLPRQQRPTFRRREADGEGGEASTSPTDTSQENRDPYVTAGPSVCLPEGAKDVPSFPGPHSSG